MNLPDRGITGFHYVRGPVHDTPGKQLLCVVWPVPRTGDRIKAQPSMTPTGGI